RQVRLVVDADRSRLVEFAPVCTVPPALRAEHRRPGAHWCAGRNSRALSRPANFNGRALSVQRTGGHGCSEVKGGSARTLPRGFAPESARVERLFGSETNKP